MRQLELYFHIPFCVKKCLYCDFLSAPAGEETKRKYMKALLAETVGSAVRYKDYTVNTVFIGGGTPSVVAVEDMEHLLSAVKENYRLAENVELTIEVNPGTADFEKLSRYRRAGVNRLSIGLQSAHNGELAAIGRIHTWEQFVETFRAARKAGFGNINVDIMSALPGQTPDTYRETMKKVLSLEQPPEHISAYSLILEEGTPFYDMFQEGRLQFPDEDTDRLMFQETKEILARAGYQRYEISNYCRKGFECRHNCGYWRRADYVGFGLGAASLVRNVRFRNGDDLNAYLAHPLECRVEVHSLSRQEQMEEFMFLGLRMADGIGRAAFAREFGCAPEEVYGEVIERNIRDGLLQKFSESPRDTVSAPPDDVKEGAPPDGVKEGAPPDGMKEGAPPDDVKEGAPLAEDVTRFALTDKGLDVSNYVMAQFLLT